MRHRTTGNANATHAILISWLTRSLILSVAHVRQETLIQRRRYDNGILGCLTDKGMAFELFDLLILYRRHRTHYDGEDGRVR